MSKKTLASFQDPKERIKNFDEVEYTYTEEEAIKEAKRCIQCKNPKCKGACPVNVYIPEFIKEVAEANFFQAYDILIKQNSLPAVCGRVCPQEKQCESKCILGIKGESVSIGRLERFVADYYMNNSKKEIERIKSNGIKVAIVGAGPAGLACAGDLSKYGYEVNIFEALHTAGGVLIYGIPEFRLPKKIVQNEIKNLEKLGVKIEKNVIVGKSITVDELKEEGFKAVFIGSGAGLPRAIGIEGENLNGVYYANEFLTRVNLMKAYKENSPTPIQKSNKTAVIGGGNVAMDAARTAIRLGVKEVSIIYRRSEEELPARKEEIEHAKEEGINFIFLSNPIKIIGENDRVSKIECVKMELGEADKTGRRSFNEIKGSNFEIEVDQIVIAIGQNPNPIINQNTEGLFTNSRGGIIVEEETMQTSKENVFAGGDAVTGAATVILAMGAGKKAAKAIHEKLSKIN